MPEQIWVRGENGAVHVFDLPLPSGIEDRMARGDLEQIDGPGGAPVEEEPDDSGAPPDAPPLPSRSEPKKVWQDFAVQQGMGREKVAAMTKNELIEFLRAGE